jgi:hypothetical protein
MTGTVEQNIEDIYPIRIGGDGEAVDPSFQGK